MTNTYHNNDSGGESYHDQPNPPDEGLDLLTDPIDAVGGERPAVEREAPNGRLIDDGTLGSDDNSAVGQLVDDGDLTPDQLLYRDKNDAQRASDMIGCSGTHPHDVDGRKHHMPCETHESYHDAVGQNHRDSATSYSGGGVESGSYVGGVFDITTGIDDLAPTDSFQRATTANDDPFEIGTPGKFNSPYGETEEEEEDKYG